VQKCGQNIEKGGKEIVFWWQNIQVLAVLEWLGV
jgi:hypothetical protein